MSSPYADLNRPPLPRRLRVGGMWADVEVVRVTGSTSADLIAEARAGAPEGRVLLAEEQRAGRGRHDRTWSSPPRAGLTFSLLLRPAAPPVRWPLLPLLVGSAVAGELEQWVSGEVGLKWPNDVLIDGRKVAGILAETAGSAVVVGLGLNVSTREAELPDARSTSLQLSVDETVDRLPVLRAVLRAIERDYTAWNRNGGAPQTVLPDYRRRSSTLGRQVRVELPDEAPVTGRAVAVDDAGLLVVETGAGQRSFAAADVEHLRPA